MAQSKTTAVAVSKEIHAKILRQMDIERRPTIQNMVEWMILKYLKHAPKPTPEPNRKTLSELLG